MIVLVTSLEPEIVLLKFENVLLIVITFMAQISLCSLPSDVDRDGIINRQDISALLDMLTDTNMTDDNKDYIINGVRIYTCGHMTLLNGRLCMCTVYTVIAIRVLSLFRLLQHATYIQRLDRVWTLRTIGYYSYMCACLCM